jgi:hypothetical protein
MRVNDTLTANRPDQSPRLPRRRRKIPVENTDYAAFVTRVIRAHGRRIAEGDVEGLAELLALAKELDAATQAAVTGLREFGYSWGEIASRLGTTRQAAQQRWGSGIDPARRGN